MNFQWWHWAVGIPLGILIGLALGKIVDRLHKSPTTPELPTTMTRSVSFDDTPNDRIKRVKMVPYDERDEW